MKFLVIILIVIRFNSAMAASDNLERSRNENALYRVFLHFDYDKEEKSIKAEEILSHFISVAKQKHWNVQLVKHEGMQVIRHPPIKKELLAEVVVAKLKWCKSYDVKCRQTISNLNKRSIEKITQEDIDFDGIMLPARYTEYQITINSSELYRERFEADKRIGLMSKDLYEYVRVIEDHEYAMPITASHLFQILLFN